MTLAILAALLAAQDETRNRVDRFGEQTKILTQGQIDAWIFEARKGETISAWVGSDAFDPVLELMNEKNQKLVEADDPGSQSRIVAEIPEDGTYRVRVGSFRNSGGGRYRLRLDRFRAETLEIDRPVTGTIDSERRSFHRVAAKAGDLLTVRLTSATVRQWAMLNPKGGEMGTGFVRIETEGAHFVRVMGPPGTPYGIVVRRAVVRKLEGAAKGEVSDERTEAWDFAGKPGEVVVLDVRRSGPVSLDVGHVPDPSKGEGVIPPAGRLPEIRQLARQDKGARSLRTYMLGREGTYRAIVQGSGTIPVSYDIRAVRDLPRAEPGDETKADLPVGEFALYALDLQAGQIVTVDVTTDRFDSVVTLFNARGDAVAWNDDRGLELSSRLTHLARTAERHLVLVTSAGHGGGGGFALSVREQLVRKLARGAKNEGTLAAGAVEIWTFDAKKDETLVFAAFSKAFDPGLRVFDASGVELARGDLLSVRVPANGALTVWVSAGPGKYTLRVYEGD